MRKFGYARVSSRPNLDRRIKSVPVSRDAIFDGRLRVHTWLAIEQRALVA